MKLPILPPKWSYTKPFLKDEEDYERYVLNDGGALDYGKVADILENYGYKDHAALWRGDVRTEFKHFVIKRIESLRIDYKDALDSNNATEREVARARLKEVTMAARLVLNKEDFESINFSL